MDFPEDVVGVLLAGGKSSRMGGGDKCLLPLGGKPMLARVIERLRPQVTDLVLNANGDVSRFTAFGLPIVMDRLGGQIGPLAGVHAGIEWATANRPGSRFVITAATDTPFFPADFVARFLASQKGASQSSWWRGRRRNAPGLRSVARVARACDRDVACRRHAKSPGVGSRASRRRDLLPSREMGGGRIDPFFNLNRPDEFAEAEVLIGGEAA